VGESVAMDRTSHRIFDLPYSEKKTPNTLALTHFIIFFLFVTLQRSVRG
jgi:hypothetical protein